MDDEIPPGSVQWTMLATLYLRAWEARLADPILGDPFAAQALAAIGHHDRWMNWRTAPAFSRYIVGIRGRLFDDRARAFLDRHPDPVVLHLACGLDSRPLRLDPDGALDWWDVDVPPVMALRRRVYPEPGRHHTIASSVADGGWLDAVPSGRPALIMAEGLLPYLTGADAHTLTDRLLAHFPDGGELILDGVGPLMVRSSPLFHWSPRDGTEIAAWSPRLTLVERVPTTSWFARIPVRRHRVVYRAMHAIPALREFSVTYRYTF